MLNAESEFVRRKSEVEEYISHLELMELQLGISPTLMNTMKSSTLLMIYNVVESTMTNLMQDVFDHLATQNVQFDSLNDVMKTLVLQYSKRQNSAELVQMMRQNAVGLVIACFDRSNTFSGNLDSRKIRETLREVGVATQHGYREGALLRVKSERNDLAHGVKSFSDCGRAYSANQLRDFHTRTCATLKRAIDDFESFLLGQAYT